MEISAQLVKDLRERTGAGILSCKEALNATGGDIEKAIEYLQKKNLAGMQKRATRSVKEGKIGSYIHDEGRIGVLVEVDCETDFVSRTSEFSNFVKELCLQVASMNPLYVSKEDISEAETAKQKEIFRAQALESGKPISIVDKIVEGKFNAWVKEVCLVEQIYIRDDKKTIKDLLAELISKSGENIKIRRFVRFEVGK